MERVLNIGLNVVKKCHKYATAASQIAYTRSHRQLPCDTHKKYTIHLSNECNKRKDRKDIAIRACFENVLIWNTSRE